VRRWDFQCLGFSTTIYHYERSNCSVSVELESIFNFSLVTVLQSLASRPIFRAVLFFPLFSYLVAVSTRAAGTARVIDLCGKLCLSKSYTSLSLVASDRWENVLLLPTRSISSSSSYGARSFFKIITVTGSFRLSPLSTALLSLIDRAFANFTCSISVNGGYCFVGATGRLLTGVCGAVLLFGCFELNSLNASSVVSIKKAFNFYNFGYRSQ
jgi:hypothetical protein